MNVEARLRAFAAVARQRSFSRAAEELYVSQPAVSKHVASLEPELGKQLVVRGRREATLTPAGELLADYVLRAEALLANAGRALAAGEDGASGTLSLAASGIPGTYLLPELLGRFAERASRASRSTSSSRPPAAPSSSCGHTRSSWRSSVGSSSRRSSRASRSSKTRSCSSGPPSLAGRRLRARELEGLTWVSREEGSATRAAVEASRWEIGLHAVRTLELPSVGGGEAGGRERRGDRRDQPLRDRPRAGGRHAGGARRAPLAGDADDRGRDRPRRPADAAGRRASSTSCARRSPARASWRRTRTCLRPLRSSAARTSSSSSSTCSAAGRGW